MRLVVRGLDWVEGGVLILMFYCLSNLWDFDIYV